MYLGTPALVRTRSIPSEGKTMQSGFARGLRTLRSAASFTALSTLAATGLVAASVATPLHSSTAHVVKTPSVSAKAGVTDLSSTEIQSAYESLKSQNPELNVSLASFTTAAFNGTLRRGKGYWLPYTLNGVRYDTWGGYYEFILGGKTYVIYCDKPTQQSKAPYYNAQVPNLQSHSTSGAYVANTAKANYLFDVYGHPSTNDKAAAVKWLTMVYSDDATTVKVSGLTKSKLTAASLSYVTKYKADVEAHYGPYNKSLTFASKPTVGKSGTATFKLSASHTGKLMANKPLKVTVSGPIKLTSSVTTTGTGSRSIPFTITGFGTVKVCGVASQLPGTKATLWWSYRGYQEYASAGSRTSVSVCASYTVTPVNAPISYTCGNVCNGIAPVQFAQNVCNTYGGAARFVMKDNGTAQSDILSLAVAACGNKTWKVADTHTAQIELQVYVGGKWVTTLLPNKIVVDCPPWPTLKITTEFNCTVGTITATTPAGKHAAQIIVNGKVVAQGVANQALVFTTGFSCNAAHTYLVQTASQRNNGSWHTSPAATVVSPVFGS